ncbi:hypothetical protein CFter6_3969 [Collimonas fungivorans]|uniref:Uncharacterized protein n=1 Tax=Collimonas fungivorans TaxID=158899 RepID=A0A127PG23_9BURK|nr:hypothetical protein CFter6_3969 [Collimonas fungivorans]
MDMQAFHDEAPSVVAQAGLQVGMQGSPPQQFSVRNANNSFMVAKLAE